MSEVIERWGLPSSLYTDRGSHYWTTPESTVRRSSGVRCASSAWR